MANRQIFQLTAEASLDSTFVIPVQKADGSEEAKKIAIVDLGISNKVDLTTDQTIDGEKTFLQSPLVPTPIFSNAATTKNYVDERNILKVVKTFISQSQILNLFTTPITILSSTTTGKAKMPLNILIIRDGSGTNYTFAANQFSLVSNSGATFSLSLSNNILTNTIPVSYTNFSDNANTEIAVGVDNEIYKLGAYTSDPTGGTGGIYVYVTYIDINL